MSLMPSMTALFLGRSSSRAAMESTILVPTLSAKERCRHTQHFSDFSHLSPPDSQFQLPIWMPRGHKQMPVLWTAVLPTS